MKLKNILAYLLLGFCSTFMVNGQAKYVFYFIGDGMGMGQISAAQGYARVVYGTDSILPMMRMPVASFASTYSASSPVTDSAAAGTALSTGYKTKNGMLGMDADTAEVVSIARILKDKGNYGIGLITTVAPDDATPAAFYAHVPHRSMFYDIGKQMAESGYEFIAGANLRGAKDKEGKPNDLVSRFKNKGVAIVRGMEGLDNLNAERILLLSPDTVVMNDVGYAIDSIPGALKLPAMTCAGLSHLQAKSPERFFMMVEGGSIDHAGHANDAATAVIETLNFNEALEVALDFYEQHPDETLIVVTADHETGGLAMGNSTLGYWQRLDRLKHVTMSKDGFSGWSRKFISKKNTPGWDEMKSALDEKMGLYRIFPVSEKEDSMLIQRFNDVTTNLFKDDIKALNRSFSWLTESVFSIISRQSGLGWTTGEHTGAVVPVFAIGVGSELFNGPLDNTQIPVRILEATGVR